MEYGIAFGFSPCIPNPCNRHWKCLACGLGLYSTQMYHVRTINNYEKSLEFKGEVAGDILLILYIYIYIYIYIYAF